MNENTIQKDANAPAPDGVKHLWILLGALLGFRVLADILSNWLSEPVSKSLALFIAYGFSTWFIFRKVSYRRMLFGFITVIFGSVGMFFTARLTQQTRLWMNLVVISILIICLLWSFAREKIGGKTEALLETKRRREQGVSRHNSERANSESQ